jgi:hypothetical protein
MDFTELKCILDSGTKEELIAFCDNNNLEIVDGKIKHKSSAYVGDQVEYWDKRQLVKKINLNSLYGSVLQSGCLFYDKRIGQSTTLTGRMIVRGMTEFTNEIITGKPDHRGDAIVYNDTDSVYFTAWPIIESKVKSGEIPWDKDIAVTIYDQVSDQVNMRFPEYMLQQFNCPIEKGKVIRAGREIVATTGLFITKKRYALLYYDKENKRYDQNGYGKVKAMGLDLKRADTPKLVQEFLMSVLTDVLNEVEKDTIIEKIKQFKTEFKKLPAWEKGTPKRVNNLTAYTQKRESGKKVMIPGHVNAAINWNVLKKMNNDHYSQPIHDGQKCIVCQLKPTPLGWSSIAYPIDELHLPSWFLELPFDESAMEEAIVDKKIENLIGVLEWNIEKILQEEKTNFGSLFDEE